MCFPGEAMFALKQGIQMFQATWLIISFVISTIQYIYSAIKHLQQCL